MPTQVLPNCALLACDARLGLVMSALRMLPVDAEPGFLIPAASFPSLNTVPEFVGKAALASIGDPFLRSGPR